VGADLGSKKQAKNINSEKPSRSPAHMWAAGLSLIAHAFMWGSLKFVNLPKQNPEDSIVQLELISEPDAPAPTQDVQENQEKLEPRQKKLVMLDQQVVDQDDRQLNDEVDEKTKFLGKHNQKVIKQSVAEKRGTFKNLQENKKPLAATAPEPPQLVAANHALHKFQPSFDLAGAIQAREERERTLNDQEFSGPRQVNLKTPTQNNRQPAEDPTEKDPGEASQTLDYIKEIDPGLETALSTKEFVFHGYYTRIRRQLEQYWNPKVKSKIVEWSRKGRSIASSEDKVTKCLITLDKKGNVLSVKIIGDSGWKELDEIAVEAFRSAAPFPNPPEGMAESDGTIQIRWDFILEA